MTAQSDTNESPFAEYVVAERKHDLSDFCDSENTRYQLGAIKYDAEHHEFVATDSRVLAIVPADGKRLSGDLLIPRRPLRAAFGLARGDAVRVAPSERPGKVSIVAGETTIEADMVHGRYPGYRHAVPTGDPEFSISFNGELLLKVCNHAVQSFGSKVRLDLHFRGLETPLVAHALVDRTVVATYVLMPLRI